MRCTFIVAWAVAVLCLLGTPARAYTVTEQLTVDVTDTGREFSMTIDRGVDEYLQVITYKAGATYCPSNSFEALNGYLWYGASRYDSTGVVCSVVAVDATSFYVRMTSTNTLGLSSAVTAYPASYPAILVLSNATEKIVWGQGRVTVRPQMGASGAAVTTDLSYTESDPVWAAYAPTVAQLVADVTSISNAVRAIDANADGTAETADYAETANTATGTAASVAANLATSSNALAVATSARQADMWTVWSDASTNYYAARADAAGVAYSGTDFSTVMQSVLDEARNGASIHLRRHASGTVFANFEVATTIVVTNAVTISGGGNPITRIMLKTGADCDAFSIAPTTEISGIVTFDNIRFVGNGANQTVATAALHFVNCAEPVVRRCEFYDWRGTPIRIRNADYYHHWSLVADCWFVNVQGLAKAAIEVAPQVGAGFGTYEFYVRDCLFQTRNAEVAVLIDPAAGVTCKNISVSGCRFYRATAAGNPVAFKATGGGNYKFQNNLLREYAGVTNSPVQFIAAASNNFHALVSGNLASAANNSWTKPFITLENAYRVTALDNEISGCTNGLWGATTSGAYGGAYFSPASKTYTWTGDNITGIGNLTATNTVTAKALNISGAITGATVQATSTTSTYFRASNPGLTRDTVFRADYGVGQWDSSYFAIDQEYVGWGATYLYGYGDGYTGFLPVNIGSTNENDCLRVLPTEILCPTNAAVTVYKTLTVPDINASGAITGATVTATSGTFGASTFSGNVGFGGNTISNALLDSSVLGSALLAPFSASGATVDVAAATIDYNILPDDAGAIVITLSPASIAAAQLVFYEYGTNSITWPTNELPHFAWQVIAPTGTTGTVGFYSLSKSTNWQGRIVR